MRWDPGKLSDINVYLDWSGSHRGLYVCKTSLNYAPKAYVYTVYKFSFKL